MNASIVAHDEIGARHASPQPAEIARGTVVNRPSIEFDRQAFSKAKASAVV